MHLLLLLFPCMDRLQWTQKHHLSRLLSVLPWKLILYCFSYYCYLHSCWMVTAGATAYTNARFGSGTGGIFLNYVGCRGTESSLLSCSHQGIGVHNCKHNEDAGVSCSGILRYIFATEAYGMHIFFFCDENFIKSCVLIGSSSNKLHLWPDSSNGRIESKRRESGNLLWKHMGHRLWQTVGLPWSSSYM